MNEMKRSPDRILYICWTILILAWVYATFFASIIDVPARAPLASLPQRIDGWETVAEKDITDLPALRADDAIVRRYKNFDGRFAELYMSYFTHIEAGKAPHAPQLCWVGSGWSFRSLGDIRLVLDSERTPFASAKVMVARKGDMNVMLVYCYWINGRYVADLGQFRILAAFDTIFKRRNSAFTLQLTAPLYGDDLMGNEGALRKFATKILSYLENNVLPE